MQKTILYLFHLIVSYGLLIVSVFAANLMSSLNNLHFVYIADIS